ncbi:unnamed protein product [Rotaria socialis]|uniref:Histone H2A n=1 Tax=Rotaria socialis TaxID=392032 RepID=A0A820TDJ7_9BILA|nr:unnamed protein product [Rotaria socialis]CAF4464204.1 unnamed protein product [Rotaria socialis]
MAPTKKGRVSRSTRAGIIFPVTRMHRYLKAAPSAPKRVTKGAAIYLAAVAEYLVAEVLELSGNAARDNRRSRIIPRHVLLAVASDEELNKLLRGCVIPQGGVLPLIFPFLLPKHTGDSSDQSLSTTSHTPHVTKKTAASRSTKSVAHKPTLTKGLGSFTVYDSPKTKAAALKGTAVTTLSERLTVVQGSIVNIKADAIIHPTSTSLNMGGEVGHALAKAGGKELRDALSQAAQTKSIPNVGDVVITDAPNLSATHLIHVNSPTWNASAQEQCISDLDKATLNILTLADEQGLTSVAIPSVSSGNAGFPKQTAAQTILAGLSKYFRQTATTKLQQVFFVLYDAESVNVYTTELQQLPSHLMAQEESKSIDLEDTFFHYRQTSKQYVLKLSSASLSIIQKYDDNQDRVSSMNNTRVIPIDDIYGCLCMKSSKTSNECYLTLYLYIFKRSNIISGIFSKTPELNRTPLTYGYGKYSDYERNFAEIIRWHRSVSQAIYLRRNLPLDIMIKNRDKRALILVNPAGGAGKAYRLVMEYVVGVWSEAEFKYHIVLTEYAGHARDFVRSLELSEWNAIVVASGDGLVYEVINGLMSRDDWQDALKLPIGHLPCGSGNAFITSIIRHSERPIAASAEQFVVQSAILIATHQVIPFDMAVIDMCDGQRVFSFLSISWGVVADVDYESEKYRFLGETRFTIEAVKNIIRPRIYDGYIDYLPYDTTDGTIQMNYTTSNLAITKIHQHLLPINEPIPIDPTTSKWRRIEGPFASVLITSKSAISKDAISTPQSTLTDGYLTLQLIRFDSSIRMNLIKAFTKLPDGKHFDCDFVESMRIRAFRIVPSGTTGNLMIDGERVPYGSIQGEILPSIGLCMGKQRRANIN